MTNFKESNLSMTAKLAVNLIKIPSITPNDLGCLDLIKARLSPLGFNCITLEDSGTTNLLALHGTGSPFFLFLGHTDVVSPGNDADWSFPPFGAEIKNIEGTDYLQGRGSQDMKSSDAAMTEALVSFVEANPNHKGCVGILLTSNEEGDAKGGTPFVVEYLKKKNLIPDYCLVGEPSCSNTFGDTIKNGRRGRADRLEGFRQCQRPCCAQLGSTRVGIHHRDGRLRELCGMGHHFRSMVHDRCR